MVVTLPTAVELLDAIDGPAEAGQDRTAELATVTRLRAVALAVIGKRAPHAPAEIQSEAAIRFVGWLRDSPQVTFARQSPYAAAWVSCGAGALCKPWVRRRATVGRP